MSDKKQRAEKTNVMRLLDQKKVEYTAHSYACTEAVSGVEAAALLGQDPDKVFKTLVTMAGSGEHYVFMVPVKRELDLKKAAKAVHEKSIEMLRAKELLPLTGYVHGGCSPIGMKKTFRTVIDKSAADFDTILFSGGKIGCQVETALAQLQKVVEVELGDICL